ncbi:MAG: hypothetical protein ACJASL_000371 [Paraglaciecola sp.]|jgi:hypothetical protein
MNKRNHLVLSVFVLLNLTLFVPSAIALNKSPELLAETWVVTPKAGKSEDLEKAIAKHTAHRIKLKDPRKWQIYSPILGNNLNAILIRSSGFTWAQMDEYRDWTNEKDPTKHWNKHADPQISNYGHYLSVEDTANNNWGPEVKYRYVGLTTYVLKPGHRAAMNKDRKLFSDVAKANKWPFNWDWSDAVSGSGDIFLAVPYQNWASMAPPDETFAEMLGKHFGDDAKTKATLQRWVSHFESVDYNIYSLRTDLMK